MEKYGKSEKNQNEELKSIISGQVTPFVVECLQKSINDHSNSNYSNLLASIRDECQNQVKLILKDKAQ